jgi:hypothetical protein
MSVLSNGEFAGIHRGDVLALNYLGRRRLVVGIMPQQAALAVTESRQAWLEQQAYWMWQNAGCPDGQDEQFWFRSVELWDQLQVSRQRETDCRRPMNPGMAVKGRGLTFEAVSDNARVVRAGE